MLYQVGCTFHVSHSSQQSYSVLRVMKQSTVSSPSELWKYFFIFPSAELSDFSSFSSQPETEHHISEYKYNISWHVLQISWLNIKKIKIHIAQQWHGSSDVPSLVCTWKILTNTCLMHVCFTFCKYIYLIHGWLTTNYMSWLSCRHLNVFTTSLLLLHFPQHTVYFFLIYCSPMFCTNSTRWKFGC